MIATLDARSLSRKQKSVKENCNMRLVVVVGKEEEEDTDVVK